MALSCLKYTWALDDNTAAFYRAPQSVGTDPNHVERRIDLMYCTKYCRGPNQPNSHYPHGVVNRC